MDLKAIKLVLETSISDEEKEIIIYAILSRDNEIIPNLLRLVEMQRHVNQDIIRDLNLEVSRYHVHINDPELLKRNKEFLNTKTKELYEKFKDWITPCFNNFTDGK